MVDETLLSPVERDDEKSIDEKDMAGPNSDEDNEVHSSEKSDGGWSSED